MFCQENYIKSLEYASAAYGEQKTSRGLPYITYVTSVAMEVIHACEKSKIEEEKSNLAITCALLHDVIENTDITYDELYVDFSENIANGVEALSKDETLESNQEKIKKSIEMLLEQPYEVQMVELANKITNLSIPSEHWDNNRKKAYLKEASFIYSCLKNSNIYLSKRLEEKIESYKKFID